jgi:integrase/recombinase XerD
MTHPIPTDRSVTTADVQAFRAYLLRWGRSPNTARAYCADASTLLNECSPMLSTLADEAAVWITSHHGDWSPATIKRRLASVNQFAEFLGVEGVGKYRRPVDAPKPYDGIDIAATRDVLERLRAVELGMGVAESRDAYAMVALCGAAGLRVGEAVEVCPSDLTLTAGGPTAQLYVRGKGKRDRVVPFPALHYHWLRSFGGHLHEVRSVDSARWLIHKTFERAGYPDVQSHQLRHAFATALFEATGDIVLVQRTLGHANVTTTQRYISTKYDEQAAAVAGLGV